MDNLDFDLENNDLGLFNVRDHIGGYFALYFCDEPIIADSACEDLYKADTALSVFNDFLEEYDDSRVSMQGWKTLQSAINSGFSLNGRTDFDVLVVDAENFLCDMFDGEFEYCELGNHGYSYGNYTVSGEIFNFDAKYMAKDKVFFRKEEDGSFMPVDWFEVPSPKEEGRSSYVFVFDKIVYDGEVLRLYDHFS